MNSQENKGLLSGIKVLDFTQALSGPYTTWQFAELGAEVWKIERFGSGDQSREWLPIVEEFDNQSTMFISYNKGKKSVEINLSKPEGKAAIYEMVKHVDVVVENFKSGSMDRLGLGYEKLSEINPKLVFVSISGFGASGPLMKYPCYDAVASGRSGVTASSGEPDGAPVKAGSAVGDTLTGVYALNAALMALLEARRSGKGCHVDIGMTDILMTMCSEAIMDYARTGNAQMRFGNHDRFIAPYGIFEARDGWAVIIADTEDRWQTVCDTLNMPALKDDPRFATNRDRIANRDALVEAIENVTRGLYRADIEKKLSAVGVPSSQVLPFLEAYISEHANATGTTKFVYQDSIGMMRFYTSPLRINNEQCSVKFGAPRLGQHTREVLQTVGYSEETIEKLYETGVVASSRL